MPPVVTSGTRFAQLNRARTAIALACLAAFTVACLLSLGDRALRVENRTDESDLKMYRRVVNRLHAGEGYYSALGSELRKGGFPSRSVLNWRTPFHLETLAIAGEPVSRWALFVLACIACLMAAIATGRAGGPWPLQLIITLLAVSNCFLFDQDFYLWAEVWTGVLLVISVCSYELECWPVGVACGILALFIRELAGPFVVVGLGFALWRRRRAEALAWLAGLALWGAYFLAHASVVRAAILPTDIAETGWVKMGGLHFVLTTILMSLLGALPDWGAALFLPAMLFGLAGWRTGIGNRVAITVAVYLAIFCVVGKPINMYWGAVTNPLLAFGLVWFLPSIVDLGRSLLRRQSGS
jgi:hypothetical protein